jgi:helicase
MNIQDLEGFGIQQNFIDRIKSEKISKLYPPQSEALNAGVLAGKSIVLSVPTAAGKTLVAALAMVKALERKGKCVYIVPLVALAGEKYEYFKSFFEGRKVAISVGDLDSKDPWLADYDIIVCTTEKLDSLIRHGSPWIKDIRLVVVDEVHLLNDASRGPTLEILMTRLKSEVPDAQTIALSATIKNSKDIAEWIDAELVVSDFRPVKLHEGIAYESLIKFYDKEGYSIGKGEVDVEVARQTLQMRKQAIIFVSTRRNAEGLAEKLKNAFKSYTGKAEGFELEKLSGKALNVLEMPTRQCKKLAACIKSGVAFHHAGLLSRQRKIIEESFLKGLVKIIVATPTLAMGVNLPAFRVVIRDAKRYYPGRGATFIPVLEYKQFVGRAGRPQFDSFGESILVARAEEEADDLMERFILGEPEEIYSKLAIEPVLRMHTLALIASGFANSEKALTDFFGQTFYAFQYGNLSAIEGKLYEIIDSLKSWKFISASDGKLRPTRLGKRVSDLYIDPLTAHKLVNEMESTDKRRVTTFSFLHAISNTLEMRPMLGVRAGEFKDINDFAGLHEAEFLCEIPEEWDLEFDDFLRSLKTAQLFEAWANEMKEDDIISKFGVAPGELYSRLKIADWLLYSMQEIGLLLGKKELLKGIRKTRLRVKYGVREELLPLVRLKGIGRFRGRRLYEAGLKSLQALREIPLASLQRIIGQAVAAQIKDQLGEKVGKELLDPKKSRQTTLG